MCTVSTVYFKKGNEVNYNFNFINLLHGLHDLLRGLT